MIITKPDIDVILLGDKNDKKAAKKILNQLKGFCKAFHSCASSLYIQSCSDRRSGSVRLYECESVSADDLNGAIIIAKKTADLKQILCCAYKPYAVIISSENEKQLKELQNTDFTVITCGLSPKDTVTFSSNDDNICIVSLQREFKIGKDIIEPQELALKNETEFKSSFSVLAAGAAVMLIKHLL